MNLEKLRTLPAGLGILIGQYFYEYNVMSAAALIYIIPPFIVLILFEKALVAGLTAGGVKG
jgi:ABC-type glycerol-3-phosphate transport system permease component